MADKEQEGRVHTKGQKSPQASDIGTSLDHSLVPVADLLPPHLLLLPVAHTTLFPGMVVPLILPEGRLTKTVEHVIEGTGYVGVVLLKQAKDGTVATGPSTSITGLPAEGTAVPDPSSPHTPSSSASKDPTEWGPQDFHRYGVAAKIVKKINLPDNQVSVLLTGLQRFELQNLASTDPFFVANVNYLYEEIVRDTEFEALLRSALNSFKQISKDNPLISEEMKVALVNIDGPGKLADFMASVLVRDVSDYQRFLETADVRLRLQHLLVLLRKELDVQLVQKRIQDEISQKVSSAQREFYLQEQLKFIQKELGRESDERSRVIQKFKERLKEKKLNNEVAQRVEEEFEKLNSIPEQSSEYSVCLNYLDWVTALPWGVSSKDSHDLAVARTILDEDHYGLKDVKERILEFLAVRKLKKSSEGSILCLVGPPGTGKTSLGRSIAQVMGRKFFRFSVGGMRDEAEIKGHRRTYVGAMPGKMIQGVKRCGTQNPVFLIDEVDKIGSSAAAGGDPASALLELLDPEQNPEFLDHYLDLPFDCSQVFFITTANTTDTIPPALLDRMEVIPLSGYTETEKFFITKRHLLPKQLDKNALKAAQLRFSEKAIKIIIARYAREAGVRNLEKQLAKICRKVAYRVAMGKAKEVWVNDALAVEKLLGKPHYTPETELRPGEIGVATGLAWTQIGGEVLFVESRAVEGAGGIKLTGSLGEVMQESANIAYTYVRGCARKLKLSEKYFETHTIHLHVPSGATPKDGPSAGITMVASLLSLLTEKPVRPELAMTGEISLTGRILPVGGIKEKLLAAKRAKRKVILLPKANEPDLKEIEADVKQGLKFVKVSSVDQALKYLF